MVKTQIDIPPDLYKKLKIFMAQNEIKTNPDGVIEVLRRLKV